MYLTLDAVYTTFKAWTKITCKNSYTKVEKAWVTTIARLNYIIMFAYLVTERHTQKKLGFHENADGFITRA